MGNKFKNCDRNTPFMMPPSIQEWLPQDHLARFVVDIVSQLNFQKIKDQYKRGGKEGYDPSMLTAMLFYGYATGIFSSRKIENASYDSVAFRYVCAGQHPDHDTIAEFRKRFLKELEDFFVEILKIAHEVGVLKLGNISIDGTKIKANASKHKALSWEYANKLEKRLKAEVNELMEKAEQTDQADIADGMNIPDEIARREDKLEVIAEAKKEISRRAKERYEQEKLEYDEKIAKRKSKEEKTGKKSGGKKPKAPEKDPKDKDQVNLTDAESRIMPVSGGGFKQSYNGQIAVDVETQMIVEKHLTNHSNDKQEIQAVIENLESNKEKIGMPQNALADAGYFSESNVKLSEEHGITPYFSMNRDNHNKTLEERFSESNEIPLENLEPVDAMKHRLKTKAGKELYAKRKSTVEPAFGIIKQVLGFREFLLRGLEAASGEWSLVCMAFNLKKLHRITVSKS